MNFKVLLFLALLVGGLVYLTRHQQEVESNRVVAYNGPLLGDAAPERLVEIRWDHVVDNRQVALEKQNGVWMIVDPIDFPAAPHRVSLLTDGLFRPASEVPGPDKDAVASHFDPPRIAVTLIEQMEGGALREHKFKVGALDADGMQVEVEKDGLYLRTLRNLDTALSVSVNDLRKRRLFDLHPERITQIERSGFSDVSGSMLDLGFEARREGPTWKQYQPVAVQLDPSVMTVWSRQLCSIYATGFASDVEDPELTKFGLHMPNAQLKLTDAGGNSQELLFAQTAEGGWVAMLKGRRHIFSLLPDQVALILDDWSILRDTRLLRAHRRDIDQFELSTPDGLVRLTQGPALDDDWTVARKGHQETEFAMEWLAEKSKIQEFLGLIEQSEIASWLPTETHDSQTVFASGVEFSRLAFKFRHMLEGESSLAVVGPIHVTDAGTRLRTYAREGDETVGLIPLAFHDWIGTPLQGWRSRLIWDLKEGRMAGLRLSQGDATREYKRKIQGTWTYMDADTSPVELLPALDHLVFLRAEEHLPADRRDSLTNPVRVEVMETGGAQHLAEIGPGPDGLIQIQHRGLSSIARNQDLYKLLSGIVQ